MGEEQSDRVTSEPGGLIQRAKLKNQTCLWVADQHTAQLIAGVRLHVRVAQTAHLIAGSQLKILQNFKGN